MTSRSIFDHPEIQAILEGISESLRREASRVVPILAKAAAFMTERGWWLLPDLSTHQCIELLKLKDQLDEQSLTASLVLFANNPKHQRLRKALARWTVSAFKSRLAIFDECLWAHEHQKYSLVVGTALIHIEGIVRDCIRDVTGEIDQPFRFDRVRKQFAECVRAIERFPDDQPLTLEDLRALQNYHNLTVLERLFEPFDPRSSPVREALNRHVIAHGVSVNYGTLESATKALLLLNMLHSMCVDAELENRRRQRAG